jgi:hypothetical protein
MRYHGMLEMWKKFHMVEDIYHYIQRHPNRMKYYKRNGYEFAITERSGDVCLAVGRKGKITTYEVCLAVGRKGKITTYEVFIMQHNAERIIAGVTIAASQSPPGNEQWGRKGWTYSSEDQAREKYTGLTKP